MTVCQPVYSEMPVTQEPHGETGNSRRCVWHNWKRVGRSIQEMGRDDILGNWTPDAEKVLCYTAGLRCLKEYN